jgi:hypothetical protein
MLSLLTFESADTNTEIRKMGIWRRKKEGKNRDGSRRKICGERRMRYGEKR